MGNIPNCCPQPLQDNGFGKYQASIIDNKVMMMHSLGSWMDAHKFILTNVIRDGNFDEEVVSKNLSTYGYFKFSGIKYVTIKRAQKVSLSYKYDGAIQTSFKFEPFSLQVETNLDNLKDYIRQSFEDQAFQQLKPAEFDIKQYVINNIDELIDKGRLCFKSDTIYCEIVLEYEY